MRIAICGDSFLSRSKILPGTHFGELLAKKLNCEITYYSNPGMSNASICTQIDSAIGSVPDLIIFNTTVSDRIELTYKSMTKDYYTYEDIRSVFSHAEPRANASLLALPLVNAIEKLKKPSEIENRYEKIESVKNYLVHMYDSNWKKQLDSYMIMGIIKKLEVSNIRYIWCYDLLQSKSEDFKWINPKNDTRAEFKKCFDIFNERPLIGDLDPGYHTLPEQQEILANVLVKKI